MGDTNALSKVQATPDEPRAAGEAAAPAGGGGALAPVFAGGMALIIVAGIPILAVIVLILCVRACV